MVNNVFTWVSSGIEGRPIKSSINFKEVAGLVTSRDTIKVIFNSGATIDIVFKDNLALNHDIVEAYNNYNKGE